MTVTQKKSTQQDVFALAIRDWLSGSTSGHLGPHMYTADNDDLRWKNGHSSEVYYVLKDEKAVFDLTLKELDVAAENFIDLGPGGLDSVLSKSLPLARKIKASAYYPIDLSPSLANAALSAINIPGKALIADFYEPLSLSKPNAFFSLLGLTAGNFETCSDKDALHCRLSEIFSHYKRASYGKSYFLVSLDANENKNEILACYQNKEFGELVRSCVTRAIETNGFDYDVTWTPEKHLLAAGLRSNQDQIIKYLGEEFPLEKGDFLSVVNSYRFPVSFALQAAMDAGWRHLKTWTKSQRIHYLLFETTAET